MNFNIDLLKAVFSATFWASLFLSYMLFRRREAAGARYLAFLILSIAIWTSGILIGLATKSVEAKNFGMSIVFFGSIFVPSLLLAFVLDYTGQRKYLTWKIFVPLNIFTITILIISLIPSTQYLLWQILSINPENNVTLHSYGPLYIPWVSYVYVIYTISIVLLFRGLRAHFSYYKRQFLVFFIASLPPIIFHLVFLIQPNPTNFVNPLPLGFAFSVIIIFFGLYNFKVFSLVPVARQKVIETINDAVLVTDKYSRVVMYNEAFVNLFSLANQKFMGKHLANILPNFEKKISLAFKMDDYSDEYSFEDKTFELSVKAIKKNESDIVGELIVLHDMTHQKRIVEQLRLANNHLHDQLSVNELLIDDLTSFSHTVAHNLKEPLNNIVGYCDLLGNNNLEQEIRNEIITQIELTGKKMTGIIDGLLQLSGISVKEVIIGTVDMGSVVDNAIRRNDPEIRNKNAKLLLPDSWPAMKGYSPWIEEVWTNLISNALKYGGEVPELRFGYEIKDASEVILYLQDNGRGLSQSQIEKLFIPFSLLENSEEGSHGLGLSIVKRIVSKLNGTVWAESKNREGEGLRISFTLPKA